jgi:hypothetical protein
MPLIPNNALPSCIASLPVESFQADVFRVSN